MVVCTMVLAGAAVTGTSMKMASSKKYENKVKAMNKEETFEFLAIGDVSYKYSRPIRGTDVKEPLYSSIAYVKQEMEGDGQGRILAVVRKPNGTVNVVLLKRPSRKNRRVNMNNPFNSCRVDPNLKTNQGEIVEVKTLKVTKKNKNTFQLEDTNVRTLQTHRKVLEVQVHNTADRITCKAPKGNHFDGKIMLNLLDLLARKGQVPKDYPSMSAWDPTGKSEATLLSDLLDDEDDDEECSESITSTMSSKREDTATVDSDEACSTMSSKREDTATMDCNDGKLENSCSSSLPSVASSSHLPAPYVPDTGCSSSNVAAAAPTVRYSCEAIPVVPVEAAVIPVAVAIATPVCKEQSW